MKKCILLFIIAFSINIKADLWEDFLKQATINGNLRSYYFTRSYGHANLLTQSAFSLGGQVNLLTGELLPGLRMGASWYFAQSLGMNSNNPKRVDNTLPGYNINTLGQAFLQYQKKYFLLRAGNQLIDTPWLNKGDSRIIPMTYQGLYGEFTPTEQIKLIALRVFQFKDKTADGFSRTNLYNPDSKSGRSGIAKYGNTENSGALAFGAQYKLADINMQAWYYRYFELANLLYLNIEYESTKNTRIQPIFGMQFLQEWGDSNNLLKSYAGGVADATAYGLLVGAKAENLKLTVGYNFIPFNKDTFRQGNILSPYTSGNDPLYTTSMIAGMVEKAPGQAVKATLSYAAFDKRLQLSTSYAKYFTSPQLPNTDELDFDVSYSLSGKAKGLVLRYRVGILDGNTSTGRFIYNRFMLQYNF